jgi:hypothetical protein
MKINVFTNIENPSILFFSKQEHPGFEKKSKISENHILQRARDLFSNGHFAEIRVIDSAHGTQM